MIINEIFATSEEVQLVEEYLQENNIWEDELQIIVFCKHFDIEIILENLNKIEYLISDQTLNFENEYQLRFISDDSEELEEAVYDYYDSIKDAELGGVSEVIYNSIDMETLDELIRENYENFDEDGSLDTIYLYIDNYFKEAFYVVIE
jgi:hypothetical protein